MPGGGSWDPTTSVRNVVALDSHLDFDTWNEKSRKVRVKWSRAVAPEVRGYHVYRRCDWRSCDWSGVGTPNMETPACEHSWVRLTSWPIDGDRTFTDNTVGGLHGCFDYAVRPVGPDYQEGEISKIVAVDLRLNSTVYSGWCDGELCYCDLPTKVYHHDTKLSVGVNAEMSRINAETRGSGGSDVGSPQAPTGVAVTTATKAESWPGQRSTKYARVDWLPNAEKDIAGYHIEVTGSSAQNGFWERLTKNPVAWWDTHYEVKGMGVRKYGTSEYIGPVDCAHFRVIAVDEFGNESPPGYHQPRSGCAATPSLPAPLNVTASTAVVPDDVSQAELDQFNSVCATKLVWDDDEGASSFNVYRLHLAGSEALYFYRTQVVDAAAECSGGTCSYVERGDYSTNASNPDLDCPWLTSGGFSLGWCDEVHGLEAYYITASYVDPVSGETVEGPRSQTVFWQCSAIQYPEGYSKLGPLGGPELSDPLGESLYFALGAVGGVSNEAVCASPVASDRGSVAALPLPSVNVSPWLTLGSMNPPYEILDMHVDHLGSTRLITGETGAVETAHDFFPFGEEIAPVSDHKNRKMFTGHERDKETGLDYMLARYYSSNTARFLSADPVMGSPGIPQRYNRYTYTLNNPLRHTDPNGEDLVEATKGFGSGVWAAGADAVRDVGNMIAHPVETAKGIGSAVAHPVKTGKAVVAAASQTLKDFKSGDDFQKGQIVGKAVGNVALAVAGTKGVDKLSKAAKTGKLVKAADKATPGFYGSTPSGRRFTKHYGTETGPERNIPGGVIDQAIETTDGVPGGKGKTVHYDPENDVTVVTGDGGGIVSARRGKPGKTQE